MTILGHGTLGVAVGSFVGLLFFPEHVQETIILSILFAWFVQDVDSITYLWGGDLHPWFGHRAITHSLLWGVISSAIGAIVFSEYVCGISAYSVIGGLLFIYLLLLHLLHTLTDAMTKGSEEELGVAFLLPFSARRKLFHPHWRLLEDAPVAVSAVRGALWTAYRSELALLGLAVVWAVRLIINLRFRPKLTSAAIRAVAQQQVSA